MLVIFILNKYTVIIISFKIIIIIIVRLVIEVIAILIIYYELLITSTQDIINTWHREKEGKKHLLHCRY